MKCDDARFALAADPGADGPAVAAHLETCVACAAYASDMAELDRRVLKALRVDVPQAPVTAAPLAAAAAAARPSPPPSRRALRRPLLALAASAAGAAILVAMLWSAYPREALAGAVVDHMSHEPQAWAAAEPLPASAIAYALARTGVRLEGAVDDVTYANTCWFRGRGVPHLVVRSATGPVTVMVLPHESVARRVTFDEGGYRGVLVPAARGSIAVLTRDSADVDAVAARAAARIRYVD